MKIVQSYADEDSQEYQSYENLVHSSPDNQIEFVKSILQKKT